MIRLENVNKYFNRHRKNEIHVINNTSLEFNDTGLVALLGPSGCGKTTLLNAIGGLDKVNTGRIFINGKKLPKRTSNLKDKLRVLNIGYIFQDYNLLETETVFENVALALKMIGIKNKSEIKRRVYYILEKVGMYRYRNKPAGMLSGGEKQRVGIARALVKNPPIIIADEPTGNLDSKNTLEIMNIIKAISQKRLVILVTHEKDLAEFYASRVIKIEDGKIIADYDNKHSNELDYRIDNKVYLKDFKLHEKIDSDNHLIDLYSDEKEKLDLDIVVKNGNIFIRSNNIGKVEIVDENSNIEFLNEHYKKIKQEDYDKTNFDLEELENSKFKIKYASIYNVLTMLTKGFKKVFEYPFLKKILLLGFFFSAMFIVFAISNIMGSTNIKDKNFVSTDRHYISIKTGGNSIKEYSTLEKDPNISYIIPGESHISLSLYNEVIYQFYNSNVAISGSLVSSKYPGKIAYGRIPKTTYEIAVDKLVIDNALENEECKMMGLNNYEDFLDKELKLENVGTFVLVGITDNESPSIYMDESVFMSAIYQSANYFSVNDFLLLDYNFQNITLKEGRLPINDYEIIVNIANKYTMPLEQKTDYKIGEEKLKVVGYYDSDYKENIFLVNTNTLKYKNILNTQSMLIYSDNIDKSVKYLNEKGYNAIDTYTTSREKYEKNRKEEVTGSLIVAGILLLISFIEIFLMIRASFLSRVKETGIYRAIGVKKKDIYKMFLGETIAITTLASMPGFILMSLLLREITKIKYIESSYAFNVNVILISLIIIYGFNIIVSMIPIYNTIRKTPAQILSRNDID